MTAGAAARSTNPRSTHYVDPSLNYTPRPLSRGQRSRQEVFVYQSPRNQRVVTVADAMNFAMGLMLEFNPAVRRYVERPRQLQLTPKTRLDLSFWSQAADGEEQFHLLIPKARTARSNTGVVALPERGELIEIGMRNGIHLTCLAEAELVSSLPEISVAYELLPLVWESDRILDRATIADHVKASLKTVERHSLAHLVSFLPYRGSRIRATVAWMVHHGIIKLIGHSAGASDALLELAND